MRYYRRKANQKAKAILLKILFVLVCAIVIFALAVVTGNLLKQHVQEAADMLDATKPPSGNAVSRKDTSIVSDDFQEDYSSLNVHACALEWIRRNEDGFTLDSEEALILRLQTLSDTYDTISLAINDDAGYYYTSSRLLSMFRQPASSAENEVYDRLAILCDAVQAAGLRLSIRIHTSLYDSSLELDEAALLDGAVAQELFMMGADEVLFTNLVDANADTDAINYARTYLETVCAQIEENIDVTIGALLPYQIFTEAVYAKQVQMIASAVDFLAIDLTEAPVSLRESNEATLEEICKSLKGSFQVYNMRIYLGGNSPETLAAQISVLDTMELTNRQYATEITAEELLNALQIQQDDMSDPFSDETESTAETTETEEYETASRSNPYAVTASSSTDNDDHMADSGANDSAESGEETPSYRTEGNSWY